MKYFFDNCVSYRFARMLAALEVDAVALRDVFETSISDDDFLSQLRDTYDVFVSADRSQQSRASEARAIKEAGVTAIWFGPFWSKMTFWEQAKWLVNRWEKIVAFTTSVQSGTCADIKQNGKASMFQL